MRQFAVIGIGRFGFSIAQTLYALGCEVLAIDKEEEVVRDIADLVTHAVQADATEEQELKTLGLRNFDVVVVAIGADIQASIMVTLIAKELGVRYIVAKAQNSLHARVLYKIGADKVVFPERDMGTRVAHSILSSSILDYIELNPNYSLVEIAVNKKWDNKSMQELDMRGKYGINVIAIRHGDKINISPRGDDIIHQDDILVVIGKNDDIERLERAT